MRDFFHNFLGYLLRHSREEKWEIGTRKCWATLRLIPRLQDSLRVASGSALLASLRSASHCLPRTNRGSTHNTIVTAANGQILRMELRKSKKIPLLLRFATTKKQPTETKPVGRVGRKGRETSRLPSQIGCQEGKGGVGGPKGTGQGSLVPRQKKLIHTSYSEGIAPSLPRLAKKGQESKSQTSSIRLTTTF